MMTKIATESGKFSRAVRAFDDWRRALMAASRDSEFEAWAEELGKLYEARDQIDMRIDTLKKRIGRAA
jgi:hypothetical protein